MNEVLLAFKPLFDAADKVKADILLSERVFARTRHLFEQRNHSTEGEWMQDYEDAEKEIFDGD